MSSSNQSKFEASFANDANGAAFKDLMKKSNSNNSGSGNSTSNSNDDQKQQQQLIHQQQLNDIKFPSSNELEDSNNRQDPPPPEDLNLFINDLLEQMQSKFENMGSTILGRIDDMGSRIDTLEKSIGDLMDQSGLSEPTYGSSGNSIKKKSVDNSDDLSSNNNNF